MRFCNDADVLYLVSIGDHRSSVWLTKSSPGCLTRAAGHQVWTAPPWACLLHHLNPCLLLQPSTKPLRHTWHGSACLCSSLLGMLFHPCLPSSSSLVSWRVPGMIQDLRRSHPCLPCPLEGSPVCPSTSSCIGAIHLLPPFGCGSRGRRAYVTDTVPDWPTAPPLPIPTWYSRMKSEQLIAALGRACVHSSY